MNRPLSLSNVSITGIMLILSLAGIVAGWQPHPTIAADDKLELVVYPSVWTVTSLNSGTNMIAVKGKNGFSGPVTVSVSGLPANMLDRFPTQDEMIAGKGGYYCSSHCQAASNSDFPVPLTVTDGQWTSFGPTMMTNDVPNQTATVTITALGGGSTVHKSFTLKIIDDGIAFGPGGPIPPPVLADPDVHVLPNDAEWSQHLYKINVTAGQSRTVNVDVRNQQDSPATATLVSNLSGSGLGGGITSSITGGFTQTSISLAPRERKTVSFVFATQASTVNGTYEFLMGIAQADGSNRATFGISSIVTGGVSGQSGGSGGDSGGGGSSPPSGNPTPSPSPTTQTPASQAPTESAAPTPADTAVPEPSVTMSPEPVLPAPPLVSSEPVARVAVVEEITETVLVPASVVTTTLSIMTFGTLGGSAATTMGLVSLWANMLLGLWNILLETLGLRRRRYPWGTVFDATTDRPAEFAIVRLKHEDGRLVETRVTDRFGRYGFLPQPGRYSLEVTKPDYQIDHSVVAKGSIYQPVWDRKPVCISEKTKTVHANIPLIATQHRFHSPLALVTILHRPALLVSLLLAAWNVTVRPTTTSMVLVGVVVVMLIAEWLLGHPRDYGRVIDSKGAPIPSVPIRLLRTQDRKVMATQLTDAAGSYSFLALPGSYEITIGSTDWEFVRVPAPVIVKEELGSLVAPSLRLRRSPGRS